MLPAGSPAMDEPLSMQDDGNDAVVVTLRRDGVIRLASDLEERFTAGRTRVVIDASSVEFLNSLQIAGIINARNRAVAAGGRLTLANLHPQVRSIFHTLKLGRLFELELDRAAALVAARR
jgi:anti-anti-sigma regulatory factor